MVKSRFTNIRSIPSKVATGKSAPNTTNFADGIATYQPNDTMKNSQLRLAENARFDRIGEYKTRVGYKKLMNPIGYSVLVTTMSSGANNTPIADVEPYELTMASDDIVYSISVQIQNTTPNVYAVPCIGIYDSEDNIIAESFIDPAVITSYAKQEAIFMEVPKLEAGTYYIKVGTQGNRASGYELLTDQDNVLSVEVHTCTEGGVSSVFEANIDGVKTVLFTQGNKLYRMAADGTTTLIRTLPAGVTEVRYKQNLNQIRYVDGKEGPRLIKPASSWSDTAIPTIDLETGTDMNLKVRNIMGGTQDNIMYFDATNDTQINWTWPRLYDYNGGPINSLDKFNVDFVANIPSIQTGDPLTAMFVLGGVLYFLTRRNKYQIYMQEVDQWAQSQSTAQNGTFSQESVVCDLNYAYFANDTGIYRFNGMDEESLTQESIQNVYDAIPDKENIILDLYQNRLYVFYSGTAGGINDHCLVYNINLEKWESFDSNTYVSATSARQNASGRFLCGHSRVGLIMQTEDVSINYNDLGCAIAFNLETAYEHFGTTSQLKRIPKWRPEFATTPNPYSVACGYALDYTDDVKYAFSVDLLNNNTVSESYVWDEPTNYGVPTTPTVLSTIPQVNGEFYRVQLRYQHIAAFEPVTFRSHTVTVQTQRIR